MYYSLYDIIYMYIYVYIHTYIYIYIKYIQYIMFIIQNCINE